MTEEQRVTRALQDATETIRDLRHKLDLAIECLEEYTEHIVFDVFEWAKKPAQEVLKKIK